MKLVLFDDYRLGLLRDDGVVDASTLIPATPDPRGAMNAVLANWDSLRSKLEELQASGKAAPLSSVKLRAPIPKPGKVMCMAGNYREGGGRPPAPIAGFLVPPEAVMDPDGTAVLSPHEFKICEHEAELVCVVGREGRNIAESDALDYIFGYTTGVDISERNSDTLTWGYMGKSVDGFKPIGPCIATPDEVGDPHNLHVYLTVDGAPRQDYNTNDIAHKIPECVAWWSSVTTLLPGDLLFLGTNHQQLGPLQDGETVEMSIDKIGSFAFHISDPLKRSWPKVTRGGGPFVTA